jgi:predicted alpha/beta hydrolase
MHKLLREYCSVKLCYKNFIGYSHIAGHVMAQWMRHCAKNRKVAGLIPDGVTGFFSFT